MDKSEISLIKFNGQNYTPWAFQLQIYLKGKELWDHVDASDTKPEDDQKAVAKWGDKRCLDHELDSRICRPQFILNLGPNKTSKDMGLLEKKLSVGKLCTQIPIIT